MGGTQPKSALTRYRDAVTGSISADERFVAELRHDRKAAPRLFAFSLSDLAEQEHDARARLAAVQ